jgi:hypothetical protein
MVLSSRWHTKRYYCSFIGNRFPLFVSLYDRRLFHTDRTTAELARRIDQSWRVFRKVGCGPGPDVTIRICGPVVCIAPPCAELCIVSVCAVDRKLVTCPVTTIPPKLLLVNRHRDISNQPGPEEQSAIAAHIATGIVCHRFPWLSDG